MVTEYHDDPKARHFVQASAILSSSGQIDEGEGVAWDRKKIVFEYFSSLIPPLLHSPLSLSPITNREAGKLLKVRSPKFPSTACGQDLPRTL